MSLKVLEPVFDYKVIKYNLKNELFKHNINIKLDYEFSEIDCDKYDYIVNASYGNINKVNKLLGVPEIKIKLQDVVVPIFKKQHSKIGLTIMDGPFCSVMPKGNNPNEFLLYSVKHALIENNNLDIDNIYKQSEKYFPFLKNVERLGYWRTERALPINDNDER